MPITTNGFRTSQEPSISSLVTGIIHDAQDLIKQQFTLLSCEVRQELSKVKTAAISLGIGIAIAAIGAIFLLLMLVHILNTYAQLPLWGCYAIVGGALLLIGGGLLAYGRDEAAEVELMPPPETAEAVKENLQWLKDQTVSSKR